MELEKLEETWLDIKKKKAKLVRETRNQDMRDRDFECSNSNHES
jgi:hypothetical protein